MVGIPNQIPSNQIMVIVIIMAAIISMIKVIMLFKVKLVDLSGFEPESHPAGMGSFPLSYRSILSKMAHRPFGVV